MKGDGIKLLQMAATPADLSAWACVWRLFLSVFGITFC